MRVLILTTFDTTKSFNLKYCNNVFQEIAHHLYLYLKTNKIDVRIKKTLPKLRGFVFHRMIELEMFTGVDHVVLVDDKGFYSRPSQYINKIKQCITGSVISVTNTNVYVMNEDINYFINPLSLMYSRNKSSIPLIAPN